MFTNRFEIQPCRIFSNKHTKLTGNNFLAFMRDNIFCKTLPYCVIVPIYLSVRQSYSHSKIIEDAAINLAVSCKCTITLHKHPHWDYISLYQVLWKTKKLAVINRVGNFKKNRSADEKNTNALSFNWNNNPNDWMFILTSSKVCNNPENVKLDWITRMAFLARFPLHPLSTY